jgi:RNA polymerase sigma-70 factor (ECF subfamily)
MIDIRRFWRGDDACFAELVQEHGTVVLGVARGFARDGLHEDDLYQLVWAQVLRKRRSYRGDGPFGAWLYRVAVNVCRSEHRKRNARTRAEEVAVTEGREREMAWTPPHPLAGAMRAQMVERLRSALLELPDRQREALVLGRLEGRKASDVARMMGVKPATVRSLIRHALDRLRSTMEVPND